jgi:methionyl-tRNA formyltransferase
MTTRLRVVVLTCGDLGARVADALSADGAAVVAAVIWAPYNRRNRTLSEKIRHVLRRQGWRGLLVVFGAKLLSLGRSKDAASTGTTPQPASGVPIIHVRDLNSDETETIIRGLEPDLAVVAGTYVLRESVFAIPRLGAINLHTGKAPEYRGAAPAFWELYNGETAVGVTIHRVVAALDAGSILAQEMFAFDAAPDGDPLTYIERFKRDVLLPNGVRMLVQTVRALAEGKAKETPQESANARTYPTPDHRAVRELRRRVQQRKTRGSAR